ncbi:hypothetical protein RJ640_005773 [Escallonia rubra]|uniref:ENTH domain-containing protein n=1 Tax=Escallonia rubra TaxID=112253 RepID=A0AA88S307_9ASTE|nr:hypothetical protein RJ640_005773 [Escallonia rubra]
MQRRFRQVFTSLREHTCVSYAKIATIGGFCDLDLLVVKATSPDDLPLPERYVHDFLKIFSISPSSYRAFALSFTRRFDKTHSWRVALKCLVLLHRLLRALPENSQLRTELLWTRSNGLMSLYPCHFRDCSSSASNDYTVFIRSYAQLLDEALDCLTLGSKQYEEEEVEEHEGDGEQEEEPESFTDKMKELGEMLEVLPQIQSLIDRVMDCRPTGAAARSFVVRSAMRHIIRDSFVCYTTFRKEIVMVLEHLIQLPYRSCIAAFGIYKKAGVQASQLCEFYDWCKSMGLCGVYEYPFIDRIPKIQIQALENFLNGMWQLTESSSSTASPLTSSIQSPSSSNDEPANNQTNWATFEETAIVVKPQKDEEMEPLIRLEVDNSESWEALLEASVTPLGVPSKNSNFFHLNSHGQGQGHGYGYEHCSAAVNGWQMQVYNPFSQTQNMVHLQGSYASNPTYPWGL